jgi:benzoyl-CoA reductase subunit A
VEPLVAGLDVGSRTIKAVVLRGTALGTDIASTGGDPVSRAAQVLETACKRAGVAQAELQHIVGTGYGRKVPSFCDSTVTEISCHAMANHHAKTSIRTVVDIGGQDCKVLRCDQRGRVSGFVMNDKCAAGTGRYLEKISSTLRISVEDLGQASLAAIDDPAPITRFCPIFVQQEILRLLGAGGYTTNQILAGACDSVVDRIVELIERVGVEPDLAISGGIGKNPGIVSRLERRMGVSAFLADDPQLMGALGAALFARAKQLKAA